MDIPPEISNDIEQVKPNSAGTKLALKLLVVAVMALAAVIVWLAKGGNKNTEVQFGMYKAELSSCQSIADKKDTEIARLNNYIIKEGQDDLKRERDNATRLNAIVDKYEKLIPK